MQVELNKQELQLLNHALDAYVYLHRKESAAFFEPVSQVRDKLTPPTTQPGFIERIFEQPTV